MPDDRLAADLDERLGQVHRALLQPRAPAAAQDHDGREAHAAHRILPRLDHCLFLFAGDRALLRPRLAALEGFYAPLGRVRTTLRETPAAVTGTLVVGGAGDRPGDWWGEPPPDGFDLLHAADADLRRLDGATFAVAAAAERARVATGAAGPACGYAAAEGATTCWATHAVAAGALGLGRLDFDDEALPEHLAFDFVGGDRTYLRGVRALPPATVVDVGGAERCFWPPAERWAPVEDPAAAAETALLETLGRRAREPALALTAGADSRVLAVALKELGLPLRTFTWGDPAWPDAQGAAHVAAALGGEHAVVSNDFLPAGDVLTAADHAARWSDGVAALGLAAREWPAAGQWLTGAGGETGRAYYWRALQHARPTRRALVDALSPERRLGSPVAGPALRARAEQWVDAAAAAGAGGWRTLDVLYAEQRVRHWGRAQLPHLTGAVIGGFTPRPVARALAWLPAADRVGDGFARRFVAARAPDLALAAPVPVRPPRLPGVVRRLRRAPAGDDPADPVLRMLADRNAPLLARADALLAEDWVTGQLGPEWAARTAAGARLGRRRAFGHVLVLCGAAALRDAVRGLGRLS